MFLDVLTLTYHIRSITRSWMDLLVPLQHPDELLDPPGAGVRLLRGLNPEEDRVPVGAIERFEEGLRLPVLGHRRQKIFRYGGTLRRMVGVLPPPVPLRVLDRPQPGRHHPPARDERSAFSLLIFDQMLRAPRGVNFCSHASEPWACFCPSIQPWQSAASSASAYETDVRALPFFAIISQTPGEDS